MKVKDYKYVITNLENFESNLKNVELSANNFAYLSFICKNFVPNNFKFSYTSDLKSSLLYHQGHNENLINNDEEIIDWFSKLSEDYFSDPCNEWHIN